MYYYFTDEDVKRAESNGISYKNMYNRRALGWDKEKAITAPLDQHPRTALWHQYEDIAVVSRNGFERRIKKGMTPYEAATKPPPKKWGKRKYTDEDLRIAAENGISEYCLKQRIYNYKMSVEEARTRPLHQKRGKGLRKKNYSKTHWNYLQGYKGV
jgi:hypothetical protein